MVEDELSQAEFFMSQTNSYHVSVIQAEKSVMKVNRWTENWWATGLKRGDTAKLLFFQLYIYLEIYFFP